MANLTLPLRAEEPKACPVELTEERNVWPLAVTRQHSDGSPAAQYALGPLHFWQEGPEGSIAEGLRPFHVRRTRSDGSRDLDYLYPLFMRRLRGDKSSWSVLHLINHHSQTEEDKKQDKGFDIWPIYFSRQTGNPDTSYRAVFPLFGPMKNRFMNDRIDWFVFPLYGRFQSGDKVVHTTPWPFIRVISGGDHRGGALWPVAGWREQKGKSRSQYYLWPLIYKDETRLDEPTPSVNQGFLPFYAMERSANHKSEIFLWPLFGYTDRSAPARYREVRWLWPFLVQGRGEQKYINRWAPFYTHSVLKGVDKTWVLWPLWRRQLWTEGKLDHAKHQFLFFLYWSHQQTLAGKPEGVMAEKLHVWPLLSAWDNGAGRRQAQFFSPLEVFFQGNEAVQQSWSPFFALLQYDQKAPGHSRTSFLWNAVSSEHCTQSGERRFHLGPLLGYRRNTDSGRLAILGGVLGFQRKPGEAGWKFFLFRFKS